MLILHWFQSNVRCPLCRYDIREDTSNSEPEIEINYTSPSEGVDNVTSTGTNTVSGSKTSQLDVNTNIKGSAYFSLINNCLAAISTPGNIGYIVAKYFEIPGCNTLLLAYDKSIKNNLEDLGFIDGINYLSFNLEKK